MVRAAAIASFLKVLLGTRRFNARSVVVIFRRGATVAGHPSLVFPPMSPFVSVLGGCLLLAPACVVLCLYAWLYDGCCFIYKAGRKPVSWIGCKGQLLESLEV